MVHKCWCNFFLSFSALYFEDAYHPPHQYDDPRWWSSGVSLRDVSGLHFEDPVADSGPGTNCGADFVSSSWSSWSWWWGWQYDERSNLPCLQITPKRSQRNLFLTTVLLGAEVGSIDIVGDNSRLVVGPGAGQGPTGSRDRGEPSRGLTQTLPALNHHPHHHCPFLLVMVWTLLELKTSQLMLQENVTIYIMGRKSLFTLGGSELEHSLRKHISSGL